MSNFTDVLSIMRVFFCSKIKKSVSSFVELSNQTVLKMMREGNIVIISVEHIAALLLDSDNKSAITKYRNKQRG